MTEAEAQKLIDAAFDSGDDNDDIRKAVAFALGALDAGSHRVATRGDDGQWTVHQWLKKAVLLSFRFSPNAPIEGGPGHASWYDKVPSKFDGWTSEQIAEAGFRAVPPCAVRRGAHIGKGAVLMPSYVNIGAYVGEGTMVDTWATGGSCAQIGSGVHWCSQRSR